MRTAKVEKLTREAFAPFGFFADMLKPRGDKLGKPPIEFFRDMVQLDLGGKSVASLSVCRVKTRPPVVDVAEYHTHCGEGILPLDNDVLIHVAPATPTDEPPASKMRIFRVPRGTLVVLRPGVWHHAPFAVGRKEANVLIVLPERTYANDCEVAEIPESKRVTFKA